MIGKIFSKLTVLSQDENKKRYYNCLCVCGVEKKIRKDHLLTGETQSCGCLISLRSKEVNTKHGHSRVNKRTSEYNIWKGMRQRCSNKNSPSYKYYGALGVTVCDRWQNSFENFLEDMGFRPFPKASIERINVYGNYELSNCVWATDKEQARNRRSTVMVEYKGVIKLLIEWCEELGLNYDLVQTRLKTLKWPVEKAFEAPKKINQYK